jgi:hypothetical protein
VTESNENPSAGEGSKSFPFNKDFLNYFYFTKWSELSTEDELKRTRKGGSNTWEERKTRWRTKPKEPTGNIKKVESMAPMIFQGYFEGRPQKFLLDSGCTTLVMGREIIEHYHLATTKKRPLRVEFANQSQGVYAMRGIGGGVTQKNLQ